MSGFQAIPDEEMPKVLDALRDDLCISCYGPRGDSDTTYCWACDDPGVGSVEVWEDCRQERIRAHAKHGDTSMESQAPDAWRRYMILAEEVGEVAKEYNEADHDGRPVDLDKLRKELIQVAAMAGAWADAIGHALVAAHNDERPAAEPDPTNGS